MRQISLRVSNDLHATLSEYAKENNLSLNAVVIQAVQKTVATSDIERRLTELENEVGDLRSLVG